MSAIKKFIRRLFVFLLKLLCVLAIIACGGIYGGVKAMNDIKRGAPHEIICKKQKLKTDESTVVRLSNSDHYVTWQSSDEKILTVAGSGLETPRTATIVGNRKGTATVTAITDGHKYTAEFTVTGQKYHKPVRIDPLNFLTVSFKGKNGSGYSVCKIGLYPGDDKEQQTIFKNFSFEPDKTSNLKNGEYVTYKIVANEKVMEKYNVTFIHRKKKFKVHGLSYRMSTVSSSLRDKAYQQTGCDLMWFGKGKKQDIIAGIRYANGSYKAVCCYGADMRGNFQWEWNIWETPQNLYSTDDATSFIKSNYASYELQVI